MTKHTGAFHVKTSNIDIYLSTLVFVENIGHKYQFQGGGVVSGRVWGGGLVQIQRKKVLSEYQYIFTHSQHLDYLSHQIGCTPNHVGHLMLPPPMMGAS